MMHPMHEYVARQLADRLKRQRVVVWYDVRREFAPFLRELRGPSPCHAPAPVTIAGLAAHVVEHDGSFFALRAAIEPRVAADTPDPLLVYVAGVDHDERGSLLMEVEKAGATWKPGLKSLARNVLRQRFTDSVIDDVLAPEKLTYDDLARAAAETSSPKPPSLLKGIFPDCRTDEALLAAWLAADAHDGSIVDKEAQRELARLIGDHLGLDVPPDAPLARMRAATLRYVLVGEFRADLRCPPPASLDRVPLAADREHLASTRDLARALRQQHANEYERLADSVQSELELERLTLPADALGSVDTFRFEERALLGHCGELIAGANYDAALAVVADRQQSFWLVRDMNRRAQWEAVRLMAEMGRLAVTVRAEAESTPPDAATWLERYTAKDGWHRLDQAQRRLETWVASLQDDPEERPLGLVRRAYEDACAAMAAGFSKALERARWTLPSVLHQTRIFSDVLAERPRPVAYLLVDAMRFEMGLELSERLPRACEVTTRAAVVALPSITPVGMAALMPGASAGYAVVADGATLGARVDGSFLPDVVARKKHLAARVPASADLTLADVLTLAPSKLKKRLENQQVIVVRSQEIDEAGETGSALAARRVMETAIDDLSRAVRKLAACGVEHAVITADHGHLFFATDRDESMRIDSPGGQVVDLHRRCWIGRGGSTPAGCTRVSAAALGYDSDLDFVFPNGPGVFRAGGDLAFYHGGASLQELLVPVLTVRMKVRPSDRPAGAKFTALGAPDRVTNRIFTVIFRYGEATGSLIGDAIVARPLLVAKDRPVGAAAMAIDGELDRTTGCIKFEQGKPVTVAFLLNDDAIPSLRVVLQDPTTDAELYRSTNDVPVRLGI